MYHLASELRQQGTVLVCTTTKIWPPAHLRVCTEEGTLREELRRLAQLPALAAASPEVLGPAPADQVDLKAAHRAIYGPARTDVVIDPPPGASPEPPYWM